VRDEQVCKTDEWNRRQRDSSGRGQRHDDCDDDGFLLSRRTGDRSRKGESCSGDSRWTGDTLTEVISAADDVGGISQCENS